MPPQAGLHTGDHRQVQSIIGVFAREHFGGQRHSQGIQTRQHHFELRQVWAMVFTVAELQQPLLGHAGITAGRRAIQTHAVDLQVIHAQQLATQLVLEGAPPLIVAQLVQYFRQAIIVEVSSCHPLCQAVPQRFHPSLRPRLHVVHPMIPFREYMGQPDRRHPTQAQPLPVTMRRKMCIQQRREPHALHVSEQQREIIHSFCGDIHLFFHADSLAKSLDRVHIYANHEKILYEKVFCFPSCELAT